MKKRKMFLIPVILGSLLSLTACSDVQAFFSDLLNEEDLVITNSYNPPVSTHYVSPDAVLAQGVEAQEIEETPNVFFFKKIGYATQDNKIPNTYKVGGANENEYNVNNGEDYYGDRNDNNYDLYVPKDLVKNKDNTVILFIHGGAWVSGFKTDVNSYVHEFANRGYITATIKYTLLSKEMNDRSLSIFRNLDEIDACITSIKAALNDLDFDTSKLHLVIGGASSGAHLSMLYAYSRGARSPLPIEFIVDAVGPVDIKPENWKSFSVASSEELETALDNGLTHSVIEARRASDGLSNLRVADNTRAYYWNEYETLRIANGMCGIPFDIETQIEACTDENKEAIVTPTEGSTSMTKPNGGEDLLSVTHYITDSNNIPIICAYGGKDMIVGIAQYAALEKALIDHGVDHEFYYFRNSNHTDINDEADPTAYHGFVEKIAEWCANI